jgi:hypothetical protein
MPWLTAGHVWPVLPQRAEGLLDELIVVIQRYFVSRSSSGDVGKKKYSANDLAQQLQAAMAIYAKKNGLTRQEVRLVLDIASSYAEEIVALSKDLVGKGKFHEC